MTNFEKAQEISENFYMPDTGFNREDLYESAMDMAEWKDKQFEEEKKQWFEKAHDWLIKNSSKYVSFYENEFLVYAYKTMSDDFMKYMEE